MPVSAPGVPAPLFLSRFLHGGNVLAQFGFQLGNRLQEFFQVIEFAVPNKREDGFQGVQHFGIGTGKHGIELDSVVHGSIVLASRSFLSHEKSNPRGQSHSANGMYWVAPACRAGVEFTGKGNVRVRTCLDSLMVRGIADGPMDHIRIIDQTGRSHSANGMY